jgi:hypothetical protein
LIPTKPVYLNGVRIADASTWFEVAEIVGKVTGISFTGKSIQQHGSEGPHGFYVTVANPRAPRRGLS